MMLTLDEEIKILDVETKNELQKNMQKNTKWKDSGS